MGKILDYESRFLESTDNLKRIVKESIGREPNSEIARDAIVCLQHGRLYFEAAEKSPLEIKPLLIFYGILNYSKGLVIARNSLQDELKFKSHGISDKSLPNSKLENLTVQIKKKGTFQEFNDSVCLLDCVEYKKSIMIEYGYNHINIPTAESYLLENKEFALKDILARIHNLSSLYNATFCEEAKTISCDISYENQAWGLARIRIKDRDIINNLESRNRIISKLKTNYPFLQNWLLTEVKGDLYHSDLIFINLDKTSIDKITKENNYSELENGGCSINPTIYQGIKHGNYKCVNFWEIIKPTWKDEANRTYFIEPFDDIYISELSLYYLGMFLLSSLVRYRPQIWMRSLSHIGTHDSPSDDAAIALIEKFLDDTLRFFPSAIVRAMNVITKSSP